MDDNSYFINLNETVLKYEDYAGNLYLYDSNSNGIFKHTQMLEDIFVNMFSGNRTDKIRMLKEKYSNINIEEQLDIIDNFNKGRNAVEDKPISYKKVYNSLWMNISHQCNLRCVYCYGVDGTYGTSKAFMTLEDAKKTIDYWIQRLDKKEKEVKVTFFGGEPTLNKKLIKFSVAYINNLLSDRYVIKYRITTNGTMIDKELLEMFRTNDFNITVSIDGDEKVHNRNRPFVNGEGSFQKALSTIRLLQENKISSTVRLTILHDNVFDLESNVNKLWEMGVNIIALNMVSSLENRYKITNEDIKSMKKQIHNLALYMMNHKDKSIYNFRLYSFLLHNKIKNKCLYFSNKNLLVETNGDIYRCHRLVGNETFKIGNIFSDNILQEGDTDKKIEGNSKCQSCWANKLCTSCPQINYVYNNDINKPYNIYCDFNKILIEEGIKLYTTIQCAE